MPTGRTEDRSPEQPLGGPGGLPPGAPKGWQTCFGVAYTDEAARAVEVIAGHEGRQALTRPKPPDHGA